MHSGGENVTADPWRAMRTAARQIERLDPGFGRLLDAYAMVDYAVLRTLRGRHPVCGPGCSRCCAQPIPVAPLEVKLLHTFWRLTRKGTPSERSRPVTSSRTCLFLGGDGRCEVYAFRPIACRQFLVFGTPCSPGEDVVNTRRKEVFTPDYEAMHRALLHTLPWYTGWPNFPGLDDPKAGVAFLQGLSVFMHSIASLSEFRAPFCNP